MKPLKAEIEICGDKTCSVSGIEDLTVGGLTAEQAVAVSKMVDRAVRCGRYDELDVSRELIHNQWKQLRGVE